MHFRAMRADNEYQSVASRWRALFLMHLSSNRADTRDAGDCSEPCSIGVSTMLIHSASLSMRRNEKNSIESTRVNNNEQSKRTSLREYGSRPFSALCVVCYILCFLFSLFFSQ